MVGAKSEGGLVEQQDPRPGHHRPRDDEHLLLATRQRAGGLTGSLGEDGEQVQHALAGLRHGTSCGAVA